MEETGGEHGRLTLRGVEVFVAVVEEGSFAGGARRLGAGPSTVSQQIANLEAALGARLIERTARPLALTAAGHLFLRRALALTDEAARARSELADLGLATLPQLRLGVVEDLDSTTTPELVAWLRERLPGCLVSVRSGSSHENVAALEARGVDIVVAAEGDDPPDWIERHPLLREPYVLFAAAGLIADGADPAARFARAPMLRYAPALTMGRQIDRHLRRLRLGPPQVAEFDSTHALLASVARLGGWALGTPLCWLRAPRFHREVEVRPLPFPGFSRTLSLLARRGSLGTLPERMAARLRALLERDAVEAGCRAMPWIGDGLRVLSPEPDGPVLPVSPRALPPGPADGPDSARG